MVRRYTLEDFNEINTWAAQRGDSYSPELLPEIGFIIPGVAAYFLYRTDSGICFLENLIANPILTKEQRDVGINQLITIILLEAKRQGYRIAYACTDLEAIEERAERFGATITPNYKLITKQLS